MAAITGRKNSIGTIRILWVNGNAISVRSIIGISIIVILLIPSRRAIRLLIRLLIPIIIRLLISTIIWVGRAEVT